MNTQTIVPLAEMDGDLRYYLEANPQTVKNLTRLTGRSETWVRDNLKKFAAHLVTDKSEGGAMFYSIDGDGAEVPAEEPKTNGTITVETASGPTEVDLSKITIDPSKHPGGIPTEQPVELEATLPEPAAEEPKVIDTGCPICGSQAEQKAAGEAGTFLGACLTCTDCKKTYNGITRKEVKGAPSVTKGKRILLNPQHKINAKVDAAKKAGGSLKFDRTDRRWVLEDKHGQTVSFTAEQFAVETPETIVAKIG